MVQRAITWIEKKLANKTQYIKMLRRSGVKIGEGCDIEKSVLFGSEPYLITIGNRVRLSYGVKFVTHDGGLWALRMNNICTEGDMFGTIQIGDGTHIGLDAIIMPNVIIGRNCIIGCGAVVTRDIPDYSIAIGVPARVIETIDEYYEKNKLWIVPTKNMSSIEKKQYLMTHSEWKKRTGIEI